MKIISRFHDFYDAVMRQGMDKEIVYLRNTEEVPNIEKLQKINLPSASGVYYDSIIKGKFKFTYETKLIGFCGVIYPYVAVLKEKIDFWGNYGTNLPIKSVFFNINDVREYEKQNEVTLDKTSYLAKSLTDFFSQNYSSLEPLFHEYKIPVFSINIAQGRRRVLVKNPNLEKLQFHKFKDTYTTFQEISMYIAGVLGNTEKDTVEIDDETMRDQKGFDEWSFKTHKEDSKKNKRKNK